MRAHFFMPIVRTLLNSALFCVALAGTCSAIRAALPFPKVLGVYQKWLYYGKHKDEIDAVFVGSSRMYHSVIPPQFDARVKETTGQTLRTFNFAYDAMWPPESLYMVRQILAMKPKKLRWLFLECLNIYPDLPADARDTRRTAYWHDARHTAMALGAVRDMKFEPLHKWDLATTHCGILLRNWTNQGRGSEWLSFELGVEKRKKDSRWDPPDAWKNDEGYQPEDDTPLAGAELKKFTTAVEMMRKKSFAPKPMLPSLRGAFADILAEIRAAGVEPIVIVTPTILAYENFEGFPPGTTVWRYHDANEYPAMYDPANRRDPTHLNHAGAKIFTDLLAARFAARLKGEQP